MKRIVQLLMVVLLANVAVDAHCSSKMFQSKTFMPVMVKNVVAVNGAHTCIGMASVEVGKWFIPSHSKPMLANAIADRIGASPAASGKLKKFFVRLVEFIIDRMRYPGIP